MLSIARNTFYLILSTVYQKFFSFLYIILLARFLGVANFGKYNFALSFAALFAIFTDFGLTMLLLKEVSRDIKRATSNLNQILLFKIFTSCILFLAILGFVFLSPYPNLTKFYLIIASLAIILDAFSSTFYDFLRGLLNLKFEAIGVIINRSASFVLGVALIVLKASPYLVVLPILLGSLFFFFNALYSLKKNINFSFAPVFDKSNLKNLLLLSWPFFLAGIFSQLFSSSDTIILASLKGDQAVGLYNAGQKLVISLSLFVAATVARLFYPVFNYYFTRSKEHLSFFFHKSVFYLSLLAFPAACGIFILAGPLVSIIYGQAYSSAVPALKILVFSLPLMFIDFLFIGLLNGCDEQKKNTLFRGVGAMALIILNFILVPALAQTGSAISCFVSFVVLSVLNIREARRLIQFDRAYLINKFFGIFTACLIMCLYLILAQGVLPLMLNIIVGAGLYFVFLYFFGFLDKNELQNFFSNFHLTKKILWD